MCVCVCVCVCVCAGGGGSLWHIPDLQDGLDLVKALDPYDDSAVKLTPCEFTQPVLSPPIIETHACTCTVSWVRVPPEAAHFSLEK